MKRKETDELVWKMAVKHQHVLWMSYNFQIRLWLTVKQNQGKTRYGHQKRNTSQVWKMATNDAAKIPLGESQQLETFGWFLKTHA